MNNLSQAVQGISAVDVGVLLLIIVCALRGTLRGFVREILSVAAVLAAVLCGALFSSLLAPLFETWLGKTPWNQILAFGAIFIAVFLLVTVLRNTLQNIIENLEWDGMDRALGFLLGAVEGLLVVYLLLFLLNLQQVVPLHKELDGSVAFKLLSPFFGYANEWLAKAPAAVQGANPAASPAALASPAAGGR